MSLLRLFIDNVVMKLYTLLGKLLPIPIVCFSTESNNIEWYRKMCAWRDKDGILCVQYANQDWYHYNEKGEWW